MNYTFIIAFCIFICSCSSIIKANKQYEDNLPTRIIMDNIENEAKGESPQPYPSWKSYWINSIERFKKYGMNDHINLVIEGRRRRGLPEL